MSDYFPVDIWREILLKLPVESLIRSTTVCKSWKSLITSPDFIYDHLSHPANHCVLRRYGQHNEHERFSLLEFTAKNGSFMLKSFSELKLPPKRGTGFYRIVGSCHGILCLADDLFWGLPQARRIILWNPSVRNHVDLPQVAIADSEGSDVVVLGFGVANHVYKVVRLVYCRRSYGGHVFGGPPRAEVFLLGTERWRSVREFDFERLFPRLLWHQVLLNRVLHWLGGERVEYGSSRSSILVFDIGDEVFREVMLPDVLAREDLRWLHLHKIEGSLAVVRSSKGLVVEGCDVWVMKEYGVKESWTKLYRIGLAEGFEKLVGFKNGEALVPSEGLELGFVSDLVSYNLETKQAKELGIPGSGTWFFIDDYVESLLLLKGNSVPVVEGCGEALEELSVGGCGIVFDQI